MTMTTAASLVRILRSDGEPLSAPVMFDYFGQAADNDEHVGILMGVYEGLVRYKFVPAALLHNCYLTNRLDELIRVKHTHWRSSYYEDLVEKGVTVGRTCHLPPRGVVPLPIDDDDHCASCGGEGYVTMSHGSFGAAPDCERCFNGICRLCVVRLADGSCVCPACSNG